MKFDATRFHSLLTTKVLGRNLLFEPSVGSTMDMARDAAAHGAPEGTLAVADEQTAGRGRLGRSWLTPPATNLASTLLLYPTVSVLRSIAMITPLAIVRAVEDVAELRPDIKWPNDVQINGKKLAGILIETEDRGGATQPVLVGVGINVNFDPRDHEEIHDLATSLFVELGREVDREALLAAYLRRLEELYDDARAGREVAGVWKEHLVTLGLEVTATWPGGSAEGVAEDVDHDGALLVRTAAGRLERVEAGDVTLRTDMT
jgi:BirA family biotin operon repressor/biotin-[acetyl-CoA-carboxylase] ligase